MVVNGKSVIQVAGWLGNGVFYIARTRSLNFYFLCIGEFGIRSDLEISSINIFDGVIGYNNFRYQLRIWIIVDNCSNGSCFFRATSYEIPWFIIRFNVVVVEFVESPSVSIDGVGPGASIILNIFFRRSR